MADKKGISILTYCEDDIKEIMVLSPNQWYRWQSIFAFKCSDRGGFLRGGWKMGLSAKSASIAKTLSPQKRCFRAEALFMGKWQSFIVGNSPFSKLCVIAGQIIILLEYIKQIFLHFFASKIPAKIFLLIGFSCKLDDDALIMWDAEPVSQVTWDPSKIHIRPE